MKKFVIILICAICLGGCSSKEESNDNLITYIDAKEQIINHDAILVDVRTEEEYNQNHIEGAISLPVDMISEDSATEILSDKDTTIIVYCQSGNRSHQAMDLLKSLGYNNVYDLGAMSNWEE